MAAISTTVCPSIKLNNGTKIPQLGLGTWLSDKGLVCEAVKHAIKMGYRHLDCAWAYKNEEEVGDGVGWALKEGICKREDLYITTKLSSTQFGGVREAIEDSLQKLKLKYVDLYLIHLPVELNLDPKMKSIAELKPEGIIGYNPDRIAKVWEEMEKLVEAGLVRSIGISNFTIKKTESLLKTAKLVPAVNQCEAQAYFQQDKLRDYCRSKGIAFEVYNSLGNPGYFKEGIGELKPLLDNEVVKRVSGKHSATPAQVCVRSCAGRYRDPEINH